MPRRVPLPYAIALALLPVASFAASPLQMRVPIGDGVTPPAYAAASSIPGLNYASSWYKAPQSAFSYGNGSYLTTSGNLQAQIALASNAGATALANMQANPAGVAGTLAQTWLAGQGLSYSGGQWTFTIPDTAPFPNRYWYPFVSDGPCTHTADQCSFSAAVDAVIAHYLANPYVSSCSLVSATVIDSVGDTTVCVGGVWGGSGYQMCGSFTPYGYAPTQTRAATSSDWAALPDPTPAVGGELPYAPYMPQGAPVGTTTITDLNTGKTYTCTNGACG